VCEPSRLARLWGVALLALTACSAPESPELRGPKPEATSLLGDALYPIPVDPAKDAELQQGLAASLARLQATPTDRGALVEYGRWLGAVNRFEEAVQTFSLGLQRWPDDVKLLRFRGHRFLTLRQFDLAVADLTRASQLIAGQPDEVEPTIPPRASGGDLDTLHENVWYHLALAHFLRGEFEIALETWEQGLASVPNDDGRAMFACWMAAAAGRASLEARERGDDRHAAELRTRGGKALASLRPGLIVEQYTSYLSLAQAWRGQESAPVLYREAKRAGTTTVDFATIGYGVANWYLCNGEPQRARQILEEVCRGPMWQAFGHIAAEAELTRMIGRESRDSGGR
jgi:tetratricopeptide (TPR) repeat protein